MIALLERIVGLMKVESAVELLRSESDSGVVIQPKGDVIALASPTPIIRLAEPEVED